MISKDMKKKEAIAAIESLKTLEEIDAFTLGEDRYDVIAAAQIMQQELEAALPKQGEQPGPITQQTHEFKGPGVEGTKVGDQGSGVRVQKAAITGSDIVEAIDKADEKKAAEQALRAAEALAAAEKVKLDAAVPRNYVTGEDVVKQMRAEGKKI